MNNISRSCLVKAGNWFYSSVGNRMPFEANQRGSFWLADKKKIGKNDTNNKIHVIAIV